MWGAIIGDLIGSIYEYQQCIHKEPFPITMGKDLIVGNSFFSDDTILTIAILEATLENFQYDQYLKKYAKIHKDYKPNFTPYFKSTFSPGFTTWANNQKPGTSIGNGAMMRISPIGYLFDTEEDIIKMSYQATIPSHNSKEAIDCATLVALTIYYARKGFTKEQIYQKVSEKIKITFTPFRKFNTSCYETISNCFYSLFSANSFEETIRNTIHMGGDTDTNAAIVGSMAEALYGIPNLLIDQAREKIPTDFSLLLDRGYSKVHKLY